MRRLRRGRKNCVKTAWELCLALLMLSVVVRTSAVTVMIGDHDGFGFPAETVSTLKGADKKPVDRKNPNRKIQFEEVLPDLTNDGQISFRSKDFFDNRTLAETERDVPDDELTGVRFTDVSLAKNYGKGLADKAQFIFRFMVAENDPGYGQDHVVSLIYADGDALPRTVDVDGIETALTPYVPIGNVAGGVGAAEVSVPWEKLLDGNVIVTLKAPNEPYLAFDCAVLDLERVNLKSYPLCANESIPVGSHYIVPTGVTKRSVKDKALLAHAVKLTILNSRSAGCTPKPSGKGDPGHYLYCSDTMIQNGLYLLFPGSMATEIDALLAEKKEKDESGLSFSIISANPKDCPPEEKTKK